jgi:hypothetical protein
VVVALIMLALAAPRPYTVPEVTSAFRAETGVQLVRVPSASWSEVTTIAPRTGSTERLGRFELYILRPDSARATLVELLRGARQDRRGFYWTPDQQGGFTALIVLQPNLAANWFPPHGRAVVDARWKRLRAAVKELRRASRR